MKWLRKSQTSVEFLLVYSWIFISVLASVGVMYSFGIFDFTFSSPEECDFNKQFECEDFTLRESTNIIAVKIRNNAGEDLQIVASGTDIRDPEDASFSCSGPSSQPWSSGTNVNLLFTACSGSSFDQGETLKLEITVEYFAPASPSTTDHLLVGNLKGRVVN